MGIRLEAVNNNFLDVHFFSLNRLCQDRPLVLLLSVLCRDGNSGVSLIIE